MMLGDMHLIESKYWANMSLQQQKLQAHDQQQDLLTNL